MVLNMACFLPFFTLFLHFLTVSSQNSAEILTVHSISNNNVPSLAIAVNTQDLTQVATSVLTAETWLRTHVLSYYPAFNITHIVIGHNLICSSKNYHLFLPALQNFHHSLIRWGLNSLIKVSPSFSSHCLDLTTDSTSNILRPLIEFIQTTNSSYMINPSSKTHKIETLVDTHFNFLKNNGFLGLKTPNLLKVLSPLPQQQKPTMRKLSFVQDLSIPKGPSSLPPLVGVGPTISPPSPIPGTPHVGFSPMYSPHPHHHHYPHNLPPCNPAPPQAAAPAPVAEPKRESLWCVAKPSVPAETLQEAMDYACGEGGAECDEIQPDGNCYYPDTIVSHASYAFNNYWQKTKINGGTCSFGGTAMLINSDPSFLQCKFIVN